MITINLNTRFSIRSKAMRFCTASICCAALLSLSQPILAEQRAAAKLANCSSAEYRHFDFWIGDWQVTDAKGTVVGTNHIFPILNGCALSENWVSASGNPGVSYNFYDQSTKLWHQTWVDNSGGTLYLNGTLEKGKMILSGEHSTTKGTSINHKITWTPLEDGRVSQHWQSSTDQKKSWNDVFIGYYQRKE